MKDRLNVPFWERGGIVIDKGQLDIILLAHVQQPRGHINSTQLQCSGTERFSIDEFNEIYQGIVNAGYYIRAVYFNELDFITDFTACPQKFEKSLIYNLARNGCGDNKKTIIPAFCELVRLNYTCSASLSCALCRNKYYFTNLLGNHGVPVPRSWLITDQGTWLKNSPPDGAHVICKPRSESASQGINEDGICFAEPGIWNRFKGSSYIIQEYIEGEECEVPVFKIGDRIEVLPPVGIDLRANRILDEKASAENEYGFYLLERTQAPEVINAIQRDAKKTFELMQMDVYGRVDFRISPDGSAYVFDISTTPYTTKHSSFAFAFEQLGFQYSDIYQAVISAALQRAGSLER